MCGRKWCSAIRCLRRPIPVNSSPENKMVQVAQRPGSFYFPKIGLAFRDFNGLNGHAGRARSPGIALGNGQHHFHALAYLAKDAVLVVQVRGGTMGDKELAAIAAWASIGHRQDAFVVVPRAGWKCTPELVACAAAAG